MKTMNERFAMLLLAVITNACMTNNDLRNSNIEAAKIAYDAWQVGEKTGNYEAFRKLISPSFGLFSHPTAVRGVYFGNDARAQMMSLIDGREKTPNALTFSNPSFLEGNGSVAVQFNSEGTVMGQFPYKGYNIIVFEIKDGFVTGFREYFGDVEPSWFQQQK